ncbi:uncharacterized protein ACJ7VT_006466 [Polymixia lowei]
MMKTTMVLLVPSVVLLVNLAFAKAHPTPEKRNRDLIFDLAKNYTASLPTHVMETYVESVDGLVSGSKKCQHRFFCKVEKILTGHTNFGEKDQMVRLLGVHNEPHKEICDKQKDAGVSVEIQLGKLLDHLRECLRHINIKNPN